MRSKDFLFAALLVTLTLAIYYTVKTRDRVLVGTEISMVLRHSGSLEIKGEGVRLRAKSDRTFSLTGPRFVQGREETQWFEDIIFLDVTNAEGVWSLNLESAVQMRISSTEQCVVTWRPSQPVEATLFLLFNLGVFVLVSIYFCRNQDTCSQQEIAVDDL